MRSSSRSSARTSIRPGLGPQDAFEAALIDPQSMQSLAAGIGLTDTDALLNLQADGTVYHASIVHLTAAGGTTLVSIDLAGFAAGRAMKLYFDLLGSGALGSSVVIDDVHFVSDVASGPVAQPDSVTTTEDTPVTFDPRANDTSPSGAPLAIELTSSASHGSVFVTADGRVTYVPAADYFGPDSFEYRVGDGTSFSLPVAVTLTVTAVNDAPVVTDAALTTAEDTPLAGTLTATDVDSVTFTFHVVDGPVHGTLVLDPAGSFTYTPSPDFNGADQFTYAANDGLVDSNVAT